MLYVLIYKPLVNEGLDFQVVTFFSTSFIALYKLSCTLGGREVPGAGLTQYDGSLCAIHNHCWPPSPHKSDDRPMVMWKAVKLISRTLVIWFNNAAFKSCILKPVMY